MKMVTVPQEDDSSKKNTKRNQTESKHSIGESATRDQDRQRGEGPEQREPTGYSRGGSRKRAAGLVVEPAKDVSSRKLKLVPKPNKMDLPLNQTTLDVDVEEKQSDHGYLSRPPTVKDSESFKEWFFRHFGSFSRVEECRMRAYEGGDEFNCLKSVMSEEESSLNVCFVRHARIHQSSLGWIESCSVGSLDSDGYLESSTFGGYDRVAVKVFDLRRTFGTSLQENAHGELLMHARVTMLKHAQICPLLGCFRSDDKVFAVYPMYLGGDVFEYLSRVESKQQALAGIDETSIRMFLRKALEALQACHQAGIVHRDVSLENFVLRDDNLTDPVLIDFGVSAPISSLDGMVVHTGPVGKAKYMAPELFVNHEIFSRYDGRKADVFSLGVVLLILCIRMEPWDSTCITDVRFNRMILKGELGLILQIWGVQISKDLLHLIMRMLNPNPLERPSVEDVLASDWLRVGLVETRGK